MASIWGNDKHQHDNSSGKLPAWKRLSSLVRRGSSKRSSNGHAYAPSLQKVESGHRVLETSLSTPHLLSKHNGDANKTTRDLGNFSNVSNLKAPLLEVNLEPLRSYRLSDGWLDNDPPPPPPPPKDDAVIRRDSRRLSSTPIADLFSKSTDQLATALQTISRKPVPPRPEPTIPEPSIPEGNDESTSQQPHRQSSTASDTRGRRPLTIAVEPDAASSVLPQPIRISLRDSSVGFDGDAQATSKRQNSGRKAVRSSWAGSNSSQAVPTSPREAAPSDSAAKSSVRQLNLLRSVGNNTSGMRVSGTGASGNGGSGGGVDDASKRHSMPSPTELQFASANLNRAHDTIATRTASPVTALRPTLTPADDARRRTWQPPVSPALTNSSTTSSQRRSVSGSRPPSTALTSSRLAWIRELEGGRKKSSISGSDSKALRDVGGGVAGKLAMFEQKQQSSSKPAGSLLCRSNSNASRASRISSSAIGASSNDDDVPTTRRTSVDSTRSAAAPVMAYYDEAFREKMEGLTQLASKRLNGEDETLPESQQQDGLRKVTARMVEVDAVKTVKTANVDAEDKKPVKKQTDLKPVEEQPVAKPAEEQVSVKPVEEQPVEEQPVAKPVEEQPASEPAEEPAAIPSVEQPVATLVEEQPTAKPVEEPAVVKPVEVESSQQKEEVVVKPVEDQEIPKQEEKVVVEQAEAHVEKAEEKKVEPPAEPLAPSSDSLKM